MQDKKVQDLDNFENASQNTIAQAASMGTFGMAVESVTGFTQVNPSPLESEYRNKILRDEDTTKIKV